MAISSTRTAASAKKPAPLKSASTAKKASSTKTSKAPAAKKPATAKPASKPAALKKASPSAATTRSAPAKPSAKSATASAPTPEQRYRMVQEAAYFLAEKNGFAGNAEGYWIEAEIQVGRMLTGSKK